MAEQILEGTREEIATHAEELIGKRLRVTVLDDVSPPRRNEAMLDVMRRVAERNKDRPTTSGEDTQQLLREGRDGKMYGAESDE